MRRVSGGEGLVILHLAADAAIALALADISALIVLLFSLADGKFKLHELPLNIQTNRDQSQAFSPGFSDETTDFRAPEEKGARPAVIMVDFHAGSGIAGDEGVRQDEFGAVNRDKGAFEAGMAGFHALHLAAGQDQARLIVVLEGVIKGSAAIVGDFFAWFHRLI